MAEILNPSTAPKASVHLGAPTKADQAAPLRDIKREPSHFAYIDAVRGLAFLAVLATHSALVVGAFHGKGLLNQGVYGVQLFFLASAITLCHSMAARQKIDKSPVLYFFIRRLFRIAPLFWLAMVVYWTFPTIMSTGFCGSYWKPPHGVHPSHFVLTALFLHGWHPYTFNSVVPGGWSVAVEMTFYLFFPLIFHFLGFSLKKTTVAVLLGIVCLRMLEHVYPSLRHYFTAGIPDRFWGFFTEHWFPAQLPVFLIGFLASP